MCGNVFKKVEHIDCKIVVFEVKKTIFITPCKIGLTNFGFSLLKTFALHKVKSSYIILGNWVENL
jgi:hypothetical protein